ncbi:translocation protein sec63, putative [Rhizoctonia solani AG-3 Rhs1AP]|uniref:Translocation protein sec63, putative n=1 Tax=Rhizoctonia solani AG-3 Rhs1AP TaxID=1086054 RepID=X8J1K3_9AGAM|nr:translocation protein sec63, putative [Rhizoctonia solani AG-3 Rhs1AP]
MSSHVQSRMLLDCNADFVVYSLLSGFGSVTERERDATRFILGVLMPKVLMTNDAYTLAQLYLPELRVMASRHSYVHKGPLKSSKQARVLLNIVVSPLVFHLSSEERKQILGSIGDAEALLSNPLDLLNEFVAAWKIRYLELFTNWRSLPIVGVDGYHFGVKLPVPLTLEEVLTPLPYPPKLPPTVWTRCEKTPNRHAELPPLLPKPIDFQLAGRSVSSKSVKKSDLEALNPRPQYFILPDLTRTSSDSSSVSTDDCGFSSLGSDSPLLEVEVFEESTWDLVEDWSELGCTHHEGRVCCIYTGCHSTSSSTGKPGERIMGQWRRVIRKR